MIEKLHRIVELAHQINRSKTACVHIDYSGHVDCLRAYAYPVGIEYKPGIEGFRIFNHRIYDLCFHADQMDVIVADMEALLEVAHV